MIYFMALLLSLTAFFSTCVKAEAPKIVDPTVISMSSWEVYQGKGNPSMDSYGRPTSLSQWQKITDYKPPYFHFPLLTQRWFRSTFLVGWHYKNAQLALSLGPLFADAQVYVNGVKLTQLEENRAARFYRHSQTRIYLLPRHKLWFSFLDFRRENQILVHLIGNKEPLTLNPKQVQVGNYETLALKAKDSDTLIKIAQGSMVALLLSFCLFSIFMRAVGFKERDNSLFGAYVVCVAGGILSDSLLLPDTLGYGSAHSPFPALFSTFAVFVLVVLLSPRQRVARLTGLLFLINLFVLLCLFLEPYNGTFYQGLLVCNQVLSAAILLHALFRHAFFKRTESKSPFSGRLLLILTSLGWLAQFFWAFNYSPAQPLNITLFIAAIILLLNVAQRFRAMASSLLTLSNRLVSIREIERERLTRDIHDGVGQGLSTLKLLINLNASKLESNLGEMLKSEVANTSNTLKSVIRNLKPIEVMSGSPTQAIISLAQHNCSLAGITLKIFSKDEVTLSQEGAYQVYRIGQEALNNAIKHSSAQEITLSFRVTGNIYRVQITDDGKGMEEETAEDSYGMNSMNERSMILGASLSVDSQGSNGTTILLEVPIHD